MDDAISCTDSAFQLCSYFLHPFHLVTP